MNSDSPLQEGEESTLLPSLINSGAKLRQWMRMKATQDLGKNLEAERDAVERDRQRTEALLNGGQVMPQTTNDNGEDMRFGDVLGNVTIEQPATEEPKKSLVGPLVKMLTVGALSALSGGIGVGILAYFLQAGGDADIEPPVKFPDMSAILSLDRNN